MAEVTETSAAPGAAADAVVPNVTQENGEMLEQHDEEQQRQQEVSMWPDQLDTPSPPFSAYSQATGTHDGFIRGETGMLFPQASRREMVELPIGLSEWHSGVEPPQSTWGQLLSMSQCCPGYPTQSTTESMLPPSGDEQYMWRWTREGKLQLTCGQPIVPVPVIQEVHRRDKIIEVPQVDVLDAVKPKVFNQGVEHEVPVMEIQAEREDFEVKQFKYVETEVVVPIITGFTHKFVPKWEIREVPRPVVKYVGKQEVIEVEVPQVKFVDRVVEREVIVDTIERKVPKVIEVPKYVDTVKYVWTPVEKIVHVERFVPIFDVSLECPAPLIVPYPVQAVKEMPAVMVRKAIPGATEDGTVVEEQHTLAVSSPCGTVRVPEEYIREYRRVNVEEEGACCGSDRVVVDCSAQRGAQADRSFPGLCGGGVDIQEIQPRYFTADQMKQLRFMSPLSEAKEGVEEMTIEESPFVDGEPPRELASMLRNEDAAAVRAAVNVGKASRAAPAEEEREHLEARY